MTTFRPFSQRHSASRPNAHACRPKAFTLIEMLVVIGIILLLSAILFPAFKGVQENGAQTTCATNMQQIYLAVRLYKDDEREYPSSLAALLPDTTQLQTTAGAADADKGQNIYGTGYFRKGVDSLICPDDDTDAPPVDASTSSTPTPTGTPSATSTLTNIRSSYGDVTNGPNQKAYYETVATSDPTAANFYDDTANATRDWGRYSWNYWGLNDKGIGFPTAASVVTYLNTLKTAQLKVLLRSPTKAIPSDVTTSGLGWTIITPTDPDTTAVNGGKFYYNPQGLVADNSGYGLAGFSNEPREESPLRYSLSNRFAPESTIITHCVYHRLQTGKNVITPNPQTMYASPADASGARDIVLRVDGTAKSYDISKWNSADFPRMGHGSDWQVSDF